MFTVRGKKLNKFELRVMANLYRMTFLFAVITVVNLMLPVWANFQGYKSVFSYAIIVIHAIGLWQAWGFGSQRVMIAEVLACRIIEFVTWFIFLRVDVILYSRLIVLVLDFLEIALATYDRNKYEYIRE